jgi:eukaryotic-like serine/threonine-protein kinase
MNSRDASENPPMADSLDLSIEPAVIRLLTPEQKDRLTNLLDGYLRRIERGLPPPRESLLETNPDLAGPLQAYFDSLDELHDLAAGFQPPSPDARCDESVPAADERRLGDFRLLREIGRGGMGVVYEAEQISLGRHVALKVLPFAAVLDSRQIARFKHEAQAAAQLNHPNIVSVFAVGVERGVHYYAMQFIDGQPLDRALTELREKYSPTVRLGPTRDALCTCDGSQASLLSSGAVGGSEYFKAVTRLGIQAAAALHAAHENGVIHRDIKPSNLLLDGNGKLWITDFGLARRQTDPTLTRTGDLVGTLRYMSPEQAMGQAALVDHRTDIYSLGATLYELLTLEPAFPGDDGPALIRHIERNEPRPLRQLQPKIPLDLQTVVLKGMAKRRDDRYATAQEFSEDLQRVLDGKPTIARRPSLLDRTARWAHRHRELVAVASLIGVLALLGLTASTLLFRHEQQEAAKNYNLAEKRLGDAEDTVENLGSLFAERLANVRGSASSQQKQVARIRQDMLRDTLAYYHGLIEQDKDNPALKSFLALSYSKIGALSRQIGSNADAVDADRQAIQLFQELSAANPRNTEYRRRLGICQDNLGLVLCSFGQTEEARLSFAEAIRLQEEVLATGEDTVRCLDDLSVDYSNLGMLQNGTGDREGAGRSFSRAVHLQEQLLSTAPDKPERLCALAVTLNKLGGLYAERQPARSVEQYEKAAAMQKKARTLRPENLDYQNELALTYLNLGAVQSRSGDVAQAAESYAMAVDLAGDLERQSPIEKSYRHTLAVAFNNLGLAQSKQGNRTAAEPSFRHALDLQETLVKQDPQDVDLQSGLGGMYNNLGIFLEELKRPAEAVKAYEQAVAHQQQAMAKAPEIPRYRQFLSKHYFNYGRALRQTGRPAAAARAALARRDLWPRDPQHLFSVAEELALTTRDLSARSKADITGEITADKCGAYAVETLKRATAAGWKPEPNSNWTKSFVAIKNRADFLALTKI